MIGFTLPKNKNCVLNLFIDFLISYKWSTPMTCACDVKAFG